MLSAQQEQERSTREQAAECPPKYEDVFNFPGVQGQGSGHGVATMGNGHRHGHHTGIGHLRAPETGQGFSNSGFSEEPPPDYSSAVASTQMGNLSEEVTTNLPYQLAGVHTNPYPATNRHPYPAETGLPYPAGNSHSYPAGNSLPYPLGNSSFSPGDSTQRF